MKSILYAICFCTVGSIMWFSIGFSVIEKQYNIDIMFDSWKKIIMAFSMAISFFRFYDIYILYNI